jgi:preprotein translocase subunit SecY
MDGFIIIIVLPAMPTHDARHVFVALALLQSTAIVAVTTTVELSNGGTSILIAVGVGLDTVKQIESQLQQRNYEGFLR